MRFKYSLETIQNAVSMSTSIRGVCELIGIKPVGGNYYTIKRHIKQYKIDTSHFKGRGWSKGQEFGFKRPIEDYLSNRFEIQSNKLRIRLLKEKIFKHQCSRCNLEVWNDLPIPIELDHINGDHSDNRLENLRLLCPNCHAQTDTYRGKNK